MSMELVADASPRPLVLDVDGTLIRNDLTHEMILEAIKRDPFKAPHYARIGRTDKPTMKDEMVARIGHQLNVEHAVLEPRIVTLAHKAKADGRPVYLCSGSEESLVKRLAASLDFVDDAFGTTTGYNMTSENKAAFLQKKFPQGFDYAGNSTQDFAVWEVAQTAYGVRPPKGTEKTRTARNQSVTILEQRRTRLGPLLRVLRPILWPSALAIGLPGAIQYWRDIPIDQHAMFALILCGAIFIAALSVSDDLADIQHDRVRSDMRDRPLAAGTLSIPAAGITLILLLLAMTIVSVIFHHGAATLGLWGVYFAGLFAIRLRGSAGVFANLGIVGGGLLLLGALVI